MDSALIQEPAADNPTGKAPPFFAGWTNWPAKLPAFAYRATGVIFSFETTLILFLFAGVYKADPRFAWLPVDITALFFVVSVAAGAYILWSKGIRVSPAAAAALWMYGALTAYALLSTLWSPSLLYAQSKMLYLATLVFWPLASCALIIAPNSVRFRRLMLVLVVFASWVAVESALAFALGAAAGTAGVFVEALSGTYLSLGRVIGPGFLVLAAYGLLIARGTWARTALAVLGAVFFALLLVIGGRAPFIAAILSGLVLLAGTRPRLGRTPQRLLLQLIILIAGCCLLAYAWQSTPRLSSEMPSTLGRLKVLAVYGFQENPRFQHYAQTLYHLDDNPVFGQGIGSWPVVVGYGDARAYPHNIFLEILFELGLVGLAIFLMLLFTALYALPPWRKLRDSPYLLLALALFCNAFINANISGDLNDNRLLFAALGLLFLAAGPSAQLQPANGLSRSAAKHTNPAAS